MGGIDTCLDGEQGSEGPCCSQALAAGREGGSKVREGASRDSEARGAPEEWRRVGPEAGRENRAEGRIGKHHRHAESATWIRSSRALRSSSSRSALHELVQNLYSYVRGTSTNSHSTK